MIPTNRSQGSGLMVPWVVAILAYHEATKHSPRSVRARGHFLDWNNKPPPVQGLRRPRERSAPRRCPIAGPFPSHILKIRRTNNAEELSSDIGR